MLSTWPLISNIFAYMAGILIGALITALIVIFARNNLMKKGKLEVDSND